MSSNSGIYTVTVTDDNGCTAASTTNLFVWGTKLYVNNSSTSNDVFTSAIGNDSNYGTPSSPFATLTQALSVAAANDTIYMDAGDYTFNGEITLNGLVIYGPNKDLNNAKATRGAEAQISASTATPVITIHSAVTSYTLNGLKLVGTNYNNNVSGHVNHASGQSTNHTVTNNIIELSSTETSTIKPLVWFGGPSNNNTNGISGNVSYNNFIPSGTGTSWRGLVVNQRSTNFNITGNVFANHAIGRCVTINHPTPTTVISFNEFALSQTSLEMVMIQSSGSGVQVKNNIFTSVGNSLSVGVTINNSNYATNAEVTNNAFLTKGVGLKTGNLGTGLTSTINATCNWWNQASGSAGRRLAGTGTTISAATFANVGTDANGATTGFVNTNCVSARGEEPVVVTPNSEFIVYPNPTSDALYVNVKATESMVVELKLVDMSGRMIKAVQSNVESGENIISMSLGDLANGIYSMVIVSNNQIIHTARIVKN